MLDSRTFATRVGIFFAGRTGMSLASIGTAALFLPLSVFLPELIHRAMEADVDAAIEAFGKNKRVKKVFWTFLIPMAAKLPARVMDPATAQQIITAIAGMGG